MDDLGDVAAVAQLDDEVEVGDVAFDQLGLDDGAAMPVLHRVEHDHFVAERGQPAHGVRADVSGTAGDQDAHPMPSAVRNQLIIRVSPSRQFDRRAHP